MDRKILQKAASFCAYQERTQDEVRTFLAQKWNTFGEDADVIIAELIVLNYLNEERFAQTFSGGKFRVKRWGRLKITQELRRRGLSTYNIDKAMEVLAGEDYEIELEKLLIRKLDTLSKEDPLKAKFKLARYATGKGYESDLIWKIVDKLFTR